MAALLILSLITVALVAIAAARPLRDAIAERVRPRRRIEDVAGHGFDPGRERRAEQRARDLLRSCVNAEEWAMYRDLGFIRVFGRQRAESAPGPAEEPGYAYLVYPHKPVLAFVPKSGRLLSEYCVEFPDMTGGGRTRLPASDDVLAKWMALTSDETRVIGRANMHLVGRQLDPARVRRDLWRLREWERRNAGTRASEARSG